MDSKAIEAFVGLGKFMAAFAEGGPKKAVKGIHATYYDAFEEIIIQQHIYNGWFTDYNVRTALKALGESLTQPELERWLEKYKGIEPPAEKTVGLVMAGNIPLAGFHDFMCVLLAGHKVQAKLSSADNKLLPFLTKVLGEIEPRFAKKVEFIDGMIQNAGAYIATGSNNSSRYFDYYFSKYPNIIRKNRNSVAVLTGNESFEELEALGSDIFLYFGLGCRSVSKLYVPLDYDFGPLFKALERWKKVFQNNKYANNYDYIKAIYLLNKTPHYDNGFLILKNDEAMASPVATAYFSFYSDIERLGEELNNRSTEIQCIVSSANVGVEANAFGQAQFPKIDEYADGVDTLNFLLNL